MAIDGVEFEEEKMNLGPMPARVVRVPAVEKFSLISWLMSHGVKSKKTAEGILIGIVIFNLLLTVFIIYKFIL
ncbi:hypothetical protein KGQ27_01635 [Patescibacteria group bacterium]|nr:hypothetical protein [Patescibacteria group bacterium]MDE1946381.1 hypothetical protein [Patescibacteria group bacterium]MDE2010833.1 hypothetical protein [Patescibacteria group bacterium]MDE2233107.1 hypothetical protein [Patescibacteria group bacterium]